MKVALCLYGIVGGDSGKGGQGSSAETLKIGHRHYRQFLIDANAEVDVFVHTWSVDQKARIERLYQPKRAIYEPQIKFKVPKWVRGDAERKNNHYSKWYSTKRTLDLKRVYEEANNFKYDFVMTTRFDIALKTPFKFDGFDPDKFYAGHWCKIVNANGVDVFKGGRGPLYGLLKKGAKIDNYKHAHTGYPHTDEGLIDQWFFSGSKNMDAFASLYDRLDEYTKPGNRLNDASNRISNHRLALHHLKQAKLIDKLDFAYHLHDEFPLIRRRFLDCKL